MEFGIPPQKGMSPQMTIKSSIRGILSPITSQNVTSVGRRRTTWSSSLGGSRAVPFHRPIVNAGGPISLTDLSEVLWNVAHLALTPSIFRLK